jgi:hypothetical protein
VTDEEDKLLREVVADTAVRVEAMEKRVAQADKDRAEMMRMLTELHDGLMKPQPGHQSNLLDRMAAVTISAETGKAAGERVIWWAKVVAAGGAIISGFYAALKFGHPPN